MWTNNILIMPHVFVLEAAVQMVAEAVARLHSHDAGALYVFGSVLRRDLALTRPQGQRSLTACSSKDLEHVLIVPTTSAAFHGHAVFLGMLLQ